MFKLGRGVWFDAQSVFKFSIWNWFFSAIIDTIMDKKVEKMENISSEMLRGSDRTWFR